MLWVPLGPAGLEDDAEPPTFANQHVAVGSRVGQGVNVLPGQSGRIVARNDASGRRIWAAPVLADDDAEIAPTPYRPPIDPASVTRDDLDAWLDRMAEAGVHPSRVNSPDLVSQLLATRERPAEAVLCSCLEPDPLLPLQYEWAARHPRAFRDGLRLVSNLTGAKFASVAVASTKHRRFTRALRRVEEGASDAMVEPLADAEVAQAEALDGKEKEEPAEAVEVGRIRLVPVLNAYPQADPVLLTHTLAARRLTPDALPTQAGVIVLDAVAAVALGRLVHGCGVIRREPVGIRDHRQDLGVVAEVWRGSRLADVLLFLGRISRDPELHPDEPDRVRLLAGDYLRGREATCGDVIGNGELIFHRLPTTRPAEASPCIRCGWCQDICPTSMIPVGLLDAEVTTGKTRLKLAQRYGAASCIGCGLCDHVCPSNLPLRDVSLKIRDEVAIATRNEEAATRPVRPIVRPRGARTVFSIRGQKPAK